MEKPFGFTTQTIDKSPLNDKQLQDAHSLYQRQGTMTMHYNIKNMYEATKFFTIDCEVLVHLKDPVRGKSGVMKHWQEIADVYEVDQTDYQMKEFVVVKPDMAITLQEGNTIDPKGERLPVIRGLTVWKKVKGIWYAKNQILNFGK